MLEILIILIFISVLLFRNNTEHFSEPLKININQFYNPTGWKWTNSNTIMSSLEIKASEGEIDFDNIIARPSLGYPTQSDGFGYSNWNRLQGTNAWFEWNQATGGTGWFWWKLSDEWQKLPEELKRKKLILDMMITSEGEIPPFPVGFSLTVPDFSFSRSVRVWVNFTKNPIASMGKPDISNILIVENPNIILDEWTMVTDDYAVRDTRILAERGEFDQSMTRGEEKNKKEWFSWKLVPSKSSAEVIIRCEIYNILPSPKTFPVKYILKVKDKHRDRYIRVTLTLTENPFKKNVEEVISDKVCPNISKITLSPIRCRCNLPFLLKSHCPTQR